MVDGVIPATPGAGVQIETSQFTRNDGTVVHRERVAIGDAANIANFAGVDPAGNLAVSNILAQQIIMELRAIRMGIAMLVGDDLDPARTTDSIGN
jgi:hypothetical protein